MPTLDWVVAASFHLLICVLAQRPPASLSTLSLCAFGYDTDLALVSRCSAPLRSSRATSASPRCALRGCSAAGCPRGRRHVCAGRAAPATAPTHTDFAGVVQHVPRAGGACAWKTSMHVHNSANRSPRSHTLCGLLRLKSFVLTRGTTTRHVRVPCGGRCHCTAPRAREHVLGAHGVPRALPSPDTRLQAVEDGLERVARHDHAGYFDTYMPNSDGLFQVVLHGRRRRAQHGLVHLHPAEPA
ncbi:hypothetical protein GGX14DRAFT_578812 [Mycena pura]|uniref:Secreted protein n=1 Tax=Mycena pura TaxID=153505 RepID=A0AAD6US34_9AGAR|nr:hypothetical protein GGX14DRAFT_578812 [Mycena pura]